MESWGERDGRKQMMSEKRRRSSSEEAGSHRRNQRQRQDNGLSPLQIITGTGFALTNWITSGRRGGGRRKEAALQLSSRHPAGPADCLPPARKPAGDTELFSRRPDWTSTVHVRTEWPETTRQIIAGKHTRNIPVRSIAHTRPAILPYKNQ
ncbi:hypothetical protein ATANTOWER_019894 [Ataeniobius toweri]|uniref:Uncharacterized protein n=1 Tax=Ataeniobius toweri TaxID=208326 RepID=A0ABU7ASJ7_9TELE|nr:hypothetical protein [Ataeniobius toweri]